MMGERVAVQLLHEGLARYIVERERDTAVLLET
jgi:hypothetical protein